ncbi:MAG TPA: hypothetical protein VF547_05960 [Allosphingosinicella sp.]
MRLLPFLLLAAGCATGSAREADLSGELAGRSAGKAEECVPASTGSNLTARDPRTLVYREGGTVWVNRLAADCPGLRESATLIVELHGSRYCRGDRFRTVEPGSSIPGPSCLLGAFTPYRR